MLLSLPTGGDKSFCFACLPIYFYFFLEYDSSLFKLFLLTTHNEELPRMSTHPFFSLICRWDQGTRLRSSYIYLLSMANGGRGLVCGTVKCLCGGNYLLAIITWAGDRCGHVFTVFMDETYEKN